MRTVLGILLAVLGLAAIVTMFIPGMYVGITMFWRVAHVVAGIVLIVAAVPMIRSTIMERTDTVEYTKTR